MDLKKEVAQYAAQRIPARGIIGLGAGSTIGHLVNALNPNNWDLEFASSSAQTVQWLAEKGFFPVALRSLSAIDLYIDGCDQLDHELNALKSGGGIHTHEKLLASMAKEFIILADETKWVKTFSADYPLVLELIPDAESFVRSRLKQELKISDIRLRETKEQKRPWITANGNILLDIWFDHWPPISRLNIWLKSITGVLETSLFDEMVTEAMIGTRQGVRVIEGKKS